MMWLGGSKNTWSFLSIKISLVRIRTHINSYYRNFGYRRVSSGSHKRWGFADWFWNHSASSSRQDHWRYKEIAGASFHCYPTSLAAIFAISVATALLAYVKPGLILVASDLLTFFSTWSIAINLPQLESNSNTNGPCSKITSVLSCYSVASFDLAHFSVA
jgi:hypothetical protein